MGPLGDGKKTTIKQNTNTSQSTPLSIFPIKTKTNPNSILLPASGVKEIGSKFGTDKREGDGTLNKAKYANTQQPFVSLVP